MKSLLTFLGAVLLACAAHADSLQTLDTFLKDVSSGRASFTQVVTSPQRSGEARPRTRTSTGRFEFLRPDRFRFEYARPFPQTIVADGQTLWLHDVDLNQVTARNQKAALGSTPAALVAAGGNLQSLAAVFDLKAAADADGLQWVEARPKATDGQLRLVRVGLRGRQLVVLDIEDGLGQRSVITFSDWQSGPGLAPADFRFVPPAGADVIRP
ncbi:MAG: outer membrane lipoprotein chaperone LolA [Hydrogenophaga sp.]|nr:outer membrane lipoprotein chaperone LolA [Hydrogenophaga sp.]